jgi:hypothetical protein
MAHAKLKKSSVRDNPMLTRARSDASKGHETRPLSRHRVPADKTDEAVRQSRLRMTAGTGTQSTTEKPKDYNPYRGAAAVRSARTTLRSVAVEEVIPLPGAKLLERLAGLLLG